VLHHVQDPSIQSRILTIRKLAEIGSSEVLQAEAEEDIRAILSIVAINKGLREHGSFLVNYSEDELTEIESKIDW
jgi:hypothetical protein